MIVIVCYDHLELHKLFCPYISQQSIFPKCKEETFIYCQVNKSIDTVGTNLFLGHPICTSRIEGVIIYHVYFMCPTCTVYGVCIGLINSCQEVFCRSWSSYVCITLQGATIEGVFLTQNGMLLISSCGLPKFKWR